MEVLLEKQNMYVACTSLWCYHKRPLESHSEDVGFLMPSYLTAVLCRGVRAGGDESCPTSEDSPVKIWILLLANCVSDRSGQVSC